MSFIFAALAVLLLVFQFTASHSIAALLTVIAMGVFAFGNVPGLQVYVVQKAAQYTPNAVDVASGLNIAAFNIGIALGSVIGGQTVASLGLAQTPWIGALIVVVALLLVSLSGRLDKSLSCKRLDTQNHCCLARILRAFSHFSPITPCLYTAIPSED